jgi:RND family efflux transporter MFP subunit
MLKYFLFTLATLPALSWAAETLPVSPEQHTALGIESAPATSSANNLGLEATAKVVLPPASVRVVAAPANGLITALLYQAGERVERGQKLVSLSSPALVDAQRQYVQADLKHRLASGNASRDQRLAAQGLIAQNTWLLTKNDVDLTRADLEAAEKNIRLLGSKPGNEGAEIHLTSPMTGWVLETLVEPGQQVEAPAALIKIGDLHRLGLEIPLTPAQAKSVQAGQAVEVEGSTANATIRALQPMLDMAQNVIVRADLEQTDTHLHPGQSVKVKLQGTTEASTTLNIPASGLAWSGDKAYVFVENKQGFTPTPVNILSQDAQQANISGLSAGSRIAVKGVAALKAKWQEAEE